MAERSLIAGKESRAAEQKFEYFVVGLSLALCAYAGEHTDPRILGPTGTAVQFGALVCIVVSIVFGFLRLQSFVLIKRLNFEILHWGEQLGQMMESVSNGKPVFNRSTGDFWTIEQLKKETDNIPTTLRERDVQLRKELSKFEAHYHWRNIFGLVGFVGLVTAKFISVCCPSVWGSC